MYTIRELVRAASVEEAYSVLTAARNNTVLGGCMWLRLSRRAIGKAVDLSLLGLDQITETEDTIEIGAMVSLRQLETSALLQRYYGSLFRSAVENIVGTQFRNTATVGGSVYGRFGFSDVLTAFEVLPCSVRLYAAGLIPINEFAQMPYKKDILQGIVLEKRPIKTGYQHMRLQATDFPVLTCAASQDGELVRISVGARPQKATLAYQGTIPSDLSAIAHSLTFCSNLRGSAEYRKKICPTLIRRALEEVQA